MTIVDFKKRIRELHEAAVAADQRPTVWGGRFEATTERTGAFLAEWKAFDMPWRICEWVSDFRFEYQPETAPSDLEYLERTRLFGPGGDLELRRDGDEMLWRFIGAAGVSLPVGFTLLSTGAAPGEAKFTAADYWQRRVAETQDPSTPPPLVCLEQRSLLWGARQERTLADGTQLIVWPENRVAGQRQPPVYPGPAELRKAERVDLVYRSYLEADNVVAVWWREIAAHKEENNG